MNSKDAKVKHVSTAAGKLTVWVDDGRVLSLPLEWYPSLKSALPAERSRWRKSGAGYGIHWPALDYDLSVEGLLTGAREARTVLAHTRKFRASRQPAKSRRAPVAN
jgi:hypothetical protein